MCDCRPYSCPARKEPEYNSDSDRDTVDESTEKRIKSIKFRTGRCVEDIDGKLVREHVPIPSNDSLTLEQFARFRECTPCAFRVRFDREHALVVYKVQGKPPKELYRDETLRQGVLAAVVSRDLAFARAAPWLDIRQRTAAAWVYYHLRNVFLLDRNEADQSVLNEVVLAHSWQRKHRRNFWISAYELRNKYAERTAQLLWYEEWPPRCDDPPEFVTRPVEEIPVVSTETAARAASSPSRPASNARTDTSSKKRKRSQQSAKPRENKKTAPPPNHGPRLSQGILKLGAGPNNSLGFEKK
jgi:hypothetical protein